MELVESAVLASLAFVSIQPEEVDAVLLVSCTLDAGSNLRPHWLARLSAQLGLDRVPHYHVGMTGCGGFHWAARLAAAMVGSGHCRRVLIVTFDVVAPPLQRLYEEGTRFMYVAGDAAACCIVSGYPEGMDYRLIGPVLNLSDARQISEPSIDGEINIIARLFKAIYEESGVLQSDIDFFVTNSYSLEVSQLYCQLAGVPFSKALTSTISTHAHCFSSDNLINLDLLTRSRTAHEGQRILCFSAGPFQWGACVLSTLRAGGAQ
ncbi:hypothetical protein A3K87_13865 [Variovorax paradoxus]|uniref:Beta-ketoacyl-[acyl-carrier-protein] synthase III N-terminal domain-containing protein n=1 Tax=Variovorax paradoxus TaxID=34073 RepID=A0AA91DP63_VARPD|nr:3-oxoacyl-[acyl-carrier-protein] synthase III C-terminal domain-containing protein [Variovorax paradoxus]OAK64482.1 hypothetical protein A3K87_13865 [Variovorax paradoxus]